MEIPYLVAEDPSIPPQLDSRAIGAVVHVRDAGECRAALVLRVYRARRVDAAVFRIIAPRRRPLAAWDLALHAPHGRIQLGEAAVWHWPAECPEWGGQP